MRTRAAAALLLLVAACGGDDASPNRRPATTGTTVEAEVSTTTEADAPDEGIGAVESTLAELLVTADELGDPALADLGYAPDDDTGPCGVEAATLDAPEALVGTRIGADGREVLEELRAYDDVDAATEVVDLLRAGPTCAGARDVTEEVGADQAFAVDVQSAGDVVVVAQVADVVAYFHVVGSAAPLDVAAFGTGKVLAFLEHGGS